VFGDALAGGDLQGERAERVGVEDLAAQHCAAWQGGELGGGWRRRHRALVPLPHPPLSVARGAGRVRVGGYPATPTAAPDNARRCGPAGGGQKHSVALGPSEGSQAVAANALEGDAGTVAGGQCPNQATTAWTGRLGVGWHGSGCGFG
jgi:hypothetical protein